MFVCPHALLAVLGLSALAVLSHAYVPRSERTPSRSLLFSHRAQLLQTVCALPLPETDSGHQLPAPDGESVLDGVYWGRGVSYWDCRKPFDGQTRGRGKALKWARGPKSNLVKIDLYDVADLPDVYRRKILSGYTELDHAFNPHLAGVRIAAYGRIEAHDWKKATFSTARGAKLFAADGSFVTPGLTDAPPGLAKEGPLSWWRMTSRGDASTMYQVMTIGGDHNCQPNENGIVSRPVNAQYRLYHNPKLQPASFRPNYDCAVAAKPSTPPPKNARAASL